MAILNLKHWRKSYMLEFIKNKKVDDCFTFSVPPESEEFTYGNRVSETKTFGGSVFDHYGNETVKISLSGSTVNEEKKLIFRGKKPPKYLSGEQEIAELRKLLKEYNEITGEEKKVYLYDLSKMSAIQLATGSATRNYWQVITKDFKIKRDKGKPNTFNYTLELIGIEDAEKTAMYIDSGKISDTVKKLNESIETMQNVINYVDLGVSATSEVVGQTRKIVDKIIEFSESSPEKQLFSVLKLGDKGLRIVTGNTNNSFYNLAKSLLSIASSIGLKEAEETKSYTSEYVRKLYVFYNSNGGSYIKTKKVEYGNKTARPDNPEKENYIFLGWFDKDLYEEFDFNTEITENITLYAKWELSIASIRFNSRNGSPVPSQKVPVGEKTNNPENPTKHGFSFDFWATDIDALNPFDFNTAIINDIVLYAAWKEACEVSFETFGGTATPKQVITIGDLAIYPLTPEKENYAFSGWYSDSSFTQAYDFFQAVTESFTLYALFVRYANTVTFISNEGTEIQDQQIKIGDYAIKPLNPTKTGVDFVYWCTDSDLTNEFKFNVTPINSNITLYAKWKIKTYTIIFDSLGGTEVQGQTILHKNKAIFPEIPQKAGFVFVMWQVKTTEGDAIEYEEFDFNTEITENITLYAKWFGEDL